MATEIAAETPHWISEAQSYISTAEEVAERLRKGINGGLETWSAMYHSLLSQHYEVTTGPLGRSEPEETVTLQRDAAELNGTAGGDYSTFIRRVIPDVDVVGTATARSQDTVVMDVIITGTLADGPLHLHSEMTCTLKQGRIVVYVVKTNLPEMRRYLAAMGNPYEGGGNPMMEVASD